MKNNLIFDLGFCDGTDTKFYLEQGYKVIAVEANPHLVMQGEIKFRSQIESGQLILLNKIVADYSEDKQDFFIRDDKIEWSSFFQEIAEQDGKKSKCIQLDSISIYNLVTKYGIPYYLKVDIEGCDILVSNQISNLKEIPKYSSFELNKKEYLDLLIDLRSAGYTKFQLRNQGNNEPLSSGLFGKLLPKNKWLSFEEVLSRYLKFRELRELDYENLSFGWLDIHATF
jgi:FkbM family methyltransferase